MRFYWGIYSRFPALLFVLLLPFVVLAETPDSAGVNSIYQVASKNLDTMNSIELGRLAGIKGSVPVRIGKELNARLKEKFLETQREKLKDEPEKLKELEAKVTADDFLLDSQQLLDVLKDHPEFDVNLPEKMELMAALRLANHEGRKGRSETPNANLRELIIQELQDASDNNVASLRLSGVVSDALKALLPKLPEDLKKKAASALNEEEVSVKVLKELFESKSSEALDFDVLRSALADLRTDHSLAAGVRFASSFSRDRREDLVFRNEDESFQQVLADLLNANKAAKEKAKVGTKEGSERNEFPDGFSKVPSKAPSEEPLKGPHPRKEEGRPLDPNVGNQASVGAPGEGLYVPQGTVRGFDIASVDPGARSAIIP
ncbi:MAG: hypothetical protein KDD39_02970, partial [Bdellovibrionales bacterium]|nr:hypothetical protein [Bdellovibrionales bacterium]